LIPSTSPHFRSSVEINEFVASLELGDEIIAVIQLALSEDVGSGDVTTTSIVPPEASAVARIIAKQDGVLSGLAVAQAVFLLLSLDMRFNSTLSDGAEVVRGQTLLELTGPARAILTGERTALNFLARMSGIATLTRKFVDAIAGTKASILDTRKTAPGLRAIDKLAVKHGGGDNHRFGLFDMVLIKNNHIDYAGSLSRAVDLARAGGQCHNLELEIEARTIEEVQGALSVGVERILLDNMSLDELRRAVALCAGRAKLEASGNVSLDNVRAIAETGVDFISVGALTHSATALDVSLRWVG
jgi:nicotinate-nucleotide pyrophosphorylase (carboxylating)